VDTDRLGLAATRMWKWRCRYAYGTVNLFFGPGVGAIELTCASECLNGSKSIAILSGPMVGASAGLLPFGLAASEAIATTSSPYPDPYSLEGKIVLGSYGAAAGGGRSVTQLIIGKGKAGLGIDHALDLSPTYGIDIGADLYVGATWLRKTYTEKCCS